ncbi:MAG: tRNA lysidine(34) synthetase TilS [Finegoldia sp.]|nr:tRNA lysidine(34) synthetase TilS [Finegoldia sp.]
MDIIEKAKKTIYENKLIEKNDKIILGLSGGPDSVFLLLLLVAIRDEMNIEISCCHVNHMYRDTAKRDQDFSKSLAEKYECDFYTENFDMKKYAGENSLSIEDAGRKLRYGYFKELLEKLSYDKIAVAHHMNDQVETFFMNLFRGSGLDGLTAMDYKNNRIIRPLLNISKQEILAYLDAKGFEYVIDETNFSKDFNRNKIRLDLVPYIKNNFNPNIEKTIANTIRILSDNKKIIETYMDEKYQSLVRKKERAYEIGTDAFNKEPVEVRKNIIRKLLIDLYKSSKDISYKYVVDLLDIFKADPGKKYYFRDYVFLKTYDKVLVTDKEPLPVSYEFDFKLGTLRMNEFLINSYVVERQEFFSKKNMIYFDAKILDNKLKLRSRKNGDEMSISDKAHKKLKKIFIDKKVEAYKRDYYPILCDEREIYAIIGLRRSNLYMVDENTDKILCIEVHYEK